MSDRRLVLVTQGLPRSLEWQTGRQVHVEKHSTRVSTTSQHLWGADLVGLEQLVDSTQGQGFFQPEP